MADLTRYANRSTLKLTTKGRTSGQARTATVWFIVVGANRIALQHVRGDEANWYRNLRKSPEVQLDFGDGPIAGRATPITDRTEINDILGRIRKKYWMARLVQLFGTGKAVAAFVETAPDA